MLTNRQNYYWRLIVMRSEDGVYAVKDTVIIKEEAYLIEEVDICGDSGFRRFLNHLHYLLCLQKEGGGG